MALLFFDGFDQYDTTADLINYGGWSKYNTGTISSVVRIGTGKSISLGSANSSIAYDLPSNQAGKTLTAGFSYHKNGVVNSSAPLYSLYQTTLNESYPQISIKLNASGLLEIVRGATVLATGTRVVAPDVARYYEIQTLVANVGGFCEVKVDGVVDVFYSGDTQNQGDDTILKVALGYIASYSAPGYYDDFYLLNSDGILNNTYLGEVICEIMHPNSDSSVTWTHNTGATNYEAIDDLLGAPDDDTTYVSAATPGLKDEYGLSDLTDVNTAAGVKLITRAEKDNVYQLSFKHGIKSGLVDQQITYPLSMGYMNFIDIFETTDGLITPFTEATINSLRSTIESV